MNPLYIVLIIIFFFIPLILRKRWQLIGYILVVSSLLSYFWIDHIILISDPYNRYNRSIMHPMGGGIFVGVTGFFILSLILKGAIILLNYALIIRQSSIIKSLLVILVGFVILFIVTGLILAIAPSLISSPSWQLQEVLRQRLQDFLEDASFYFLLLWILTSLGIVFMPLRKPNRMK